MNIDKTFIALALALSAAAAMAENASAPATSTTSATSAASTTPITRAEVRAELEIYRESGLLELDRSGSSEVDTSEYRAAQKRYAALRQSDHFQTLVRRYTGAGEAGKASLELTQ